MKAYSDFIELSKEYYDINSVEMLLAWDQETYMPSQGVKDRSQQVATLSKVSHQMITSKRMGDLIAELKTKNIHDTLSPEQKTNLREMEWRYHRAVALPSAFVKEMAKTQAEGFDVWHKARAASDFSMFAPTFSKLVEMKKQEAEYIGYEKYAYDALMDGFETGLRIDTMNPLFEGLRNKLSTFVKRIKDSGIAPDTSFVTCGYPVDAQKKFCRMLAESIHYDMERGRIDDAPHPFTAGTLHDSRITVRHYPDDPRPGIFCTLHEGGHALYEQGFIEEHYGTPMAQAVSLGVHESQSRMIENIVGRSKCFWNHWYPELQKAFPKQLEGRTMEEFYAAINDVRPSLIRVEADEVTYNLHIVLRYEMEKMIISGELDVKDAPEEWNRRIDQYLGLEVPNDANGILQDIHWSSGMMGYFPTYTLGNLYASQFYHKALQDDPGIELGLEKGDISPLLGWLRENIHNKGMLHRANDLMVDVTGKPPSEEYFLKYLETKFGALYGL